MRPIASSPTVEFSGGLGDFFHRAWKSDIMKILDEAEDMVNVLQLCNNHSANDILYWHPKRHLFRIFDALSLKAHWVDRGAPPGTADRLCYEHFGIPHHTKAWRWYQNPDPLDERGPLIYYRPIWHPRNRIQAAAGAVVFAPGAGNAQRALPGGLQGEILKRLLARGLEVHALYRNESAPPAVLPFAADPLLHVHTCLTVPATAQLVRDCSACVCSHSAMLQLAWFENKRTVALYPAGHPEWTVESNTYTWGRKRSSSLNLPFDSIHNDQREIAEQTIAHLTR